MSHDFTDANRKYFDEIASSYDAKPWFQKMIALLLQGFATHMDFIGADWANASAASTPPAKPVRLLDYACGTGLATRALADHITHSVGLDISSNMVRSFNQRSPNPATMYAKIGNLLATEVDAALGAPDFFGFDIAVVCMGFHHFEVPERAVARLAERLRPGGVLLIIDNCPNSQRHDFSQFKDAQKTISTHGFAEAEMREMFADVGLEKFAYDVLPEEAVIGEPGKEIKGKVFFARASKPVNEIKGEL